MSRIHHGDEDVHKALSRVAGDVDRVMVDLEALRALLAAGRGQPIPGELTPTEFDFLSHHLARVGLAGAMIMADDLARTYARDPDADWPSTAPPKGPRSRSH